MAKLSVGIAIITHNAKHHLLHCLPPLLYSPLKPRVLVVNSSSHDGTVAEAQRMGAETLVIPRKEFNHGLTREHARRVLKTDIVVMMTPDAYAMDRNVLEKLIYPLTTGKASVSYARQIPHLGADPLEAFARQFNYPSQSHIRSIDDVPYYGIYTVFCSNACAAYLSSALDEVDGFPDVLTGEDTVVVSKLLQRGHRIAYAADAIVRHSHRYSLGQEFRRHFDTGLARKSYAHLLSFAGTDGRRGKAYAKSLLKQVWNKHRQLVPYACLHLFAKWIGYRIGKASVKAPRWFKRALSSQDFYWLQKK